MLGDYQPDAQLHTALEAAVYQQASRRRSLPSQRAGIGEWQAKYVTAVSQSNVADGWSDRRHDGGRVIDIDSNDVIASGLSMPHSPRVYRDKLWLLNSGTGHFGFIDQGIEGIRRPSQQSFQIS